MLRRIATGLKRRVRARLRTLFGLAQPYYFLPAPSVETQTVRFRFMTESLTAEASYRTPLYETVAEVVDYDCYRLREIASALCGTTLLDVGANVGVTALCLSRIPGASVVCYEPVPATCAMLKANLARNGAANATVIEAAIGQQNGVVRFWLPGHEDVGGRLDATGAAGDGTSLSVTSVDLVTALAAVEGPIGLIKLDCEGGEHEIVAQLTAELVARLPRMTLEVHDRGVGRELRAISRRLEAWGYALRYRPDPFGREELHHVLALRAGAGR